jgi:hypothetical protein
MSKLQTTPTIEEILVVDTEPKTTIEEFIAIIDNTKFNIDKTATIEMFSKDRESLTQDELKAKYSHFIV